MARKKTIKSVQEQAAKVNEKLELLVTELKSQVAVELLAIYVDEKKVAAKLKEAGENGPYPESKIFADNPDLKANLEELEPFVKLKKKRAAAQPTVESASRTKKVKKTESKPELKQEIQAPKVSGMMPDDDDTEV